MSRSIEELRQEINEADARLLAAFIDRMGTVAEVASYKAERGLPILDTSREETLLAEIAARTPEPLKADALALYQTVLSLSRGYQHRLLDGTGRPSGGSTVSAEAFASREGAAL